jgi:ABC-type siderophore export system fused ATPase/permease subunit
MQPFYLILPALSMVVGLIVWYVRTQVVITAREEVAKIGADLAAKIDRLRDAIAELMTHARLAEERHANLSERVSRLEQRNGRAA